MGWDDKVQAAKMSPPLLQPLKESDVAAVLVERGTVEIAVEGPVPCAGTPFIAGQVQDTLIVDAGRDPSDRHPHAPAFGDAEHADLAQFLLGAQAQAEGKRTGRLTGKQTTEARNAGQTGREVPVIDDEPGSWCVGLSIDDNDKAQRACRAIQHEMDAIRTIMSCPCVWRETGQDVTPIATHGHLRRDVGIPESGGEPGGEIRVDRENATPNDERRRAMSRRQSCPSSWLLHDRAGRSGYVAAIPGQDRQGRARRRRDEGVQHPTAGLSARPPPPICHGFDPVSGAEPERVVPKTQEGDPEYIL